MSHAGSPALSAILLMPRGFEELAAMLSHLTAQTIADRLEVVLVHTPAGMATMESGVPIRTSTTLARDFTSPSKNERASRATLLRASLRANGPGESLISVRENRPRVRAA